MSPHPWPLSQPDLPDRPGEGIPSFNRSFSPAPPPLLGGRRQGQERGPGGEVPLGISLCFLLATFLLAFPAWLPGRAPLLLWNQSASVPVGLYLRAGDEAAIGDLLAACLPEAVAQLAVERGYLPAGGLCPGDSAPVLKHLAATAGTVVELRAGSLAIDDHEWPAGALRQLDRQGRSIPQRVTFPFTVAAGEVLLLGDDAASFDGRYFGPVPAASVLGVYRRVWR